MPPSCSYKPPPHGCSLKHPTIATRTARRTVLWFSGHSGKPGACRPNPNCRGSGNSLTPRNIASKQQLTNGARSSIAPQKERFLLK